MKKKILYLLIAAYFIASPFQVWAGEAQDKADLAVANVLFEYDGSDEFASYRVNEDGFVDIIMSRSMPDDLYVTILDRLLTHPDIDGVLPSHSGPACKIGSW